MPCNDNLQPGDSPLLPPKPDRPSPKFANAVPVPLKDFSNSCYHYRVTRMWDPFKIRACSVCKQPTPNIGWLWRCVDDSNGFLPASDFERISPAKKVLTTFIPSRTAIDIMINDLDPAVITFLGEADYSAEELNTVPHLNPSILRAIGLHEYTHKQVKSLIYQKINVQIAIRRDLERSTHGGRHESLSCTPFRPNIRPTQPSDTRIAMALPDPVPTLTSNTRPSTASSLAQQSARANSSILTYGPTLPTSTTFSTHATSNTENDDDADEVRRAYEWGEIFHRFQHLHPRRPPDVPDPDNRLPVGIQNMLRFDAYSTHAGANLRADGFEFPELSEDFYACQANQTTLHTVEKCQWLACHRCYPKSPERCDKMDDLMNGPWPPMHELMYRPVSDANIVRTLGLRQSAGDNSFVDCVQVSDIEDRAQHGDRHGEDSSGHQQGESGFYDCGHSPDIKDKGINLTDKGAPDQDEAFTSARPNAEEADQIAHEVKSDVTSHTDDARSVGDFYPSTQEIKQLACFSRPNNTITAAAKNETHNKDNADAGVTASVHETKLETPTEQPSKRIRKRDVFRVKLRAIFTGNSKKGRGQASKEEDELHSTAVSDKGAITSKHPGPSTQNPLVGNTSLDNSLSLMIASNTPLPAGGQPTPTSESGGFPNQTGVRDNSYSSLGAAVQAAGDH